MKISISLSAQAGLFDVLFRLLCGDATAFAHLVKAMLICKTLMDTMSFAGEVGKLQGEFAKRGVKPLALSCDNVESHKG